MTGNGRFDAIRRILLMEWDPIGIQGVAAARDEYDAYARHITSQLSSGASAREIESYLLQVETEMMGLVADRERARRVADLLTASAAGD